MLRFKLPHRLLLGLLTVLVLLGGHAARSTRAQSASATWDPPTNLSQSGAGSAPAIVVDSAGRIHVTWLDSLTDSLYSGFDGEQWSAPVIYRFPFDTYFPTLLASPNGYIYAFWKDDEDQLFFSRISVESFSNPAAWESTQLVAESALDFDISFDNQSNLWVAYMRDIESIDFPAGVYVRRSNDAGITWSSSNLLYQSAYFRNLSRDFANVHIASSGIGDMARVYTVWDDRARKQVLLSSSTDGGNTWSQPVEVDRPSVNKGGSGPFNIHVSARDEKVLLIWQTDLQSAFDCTQYYQASEDGGVNWSGRQIMLDELVGCPQGNRTIPGPDDFMLLITVIQDQTYIVAWNWIESKWSEPQLQSSLSTLLNPDTLESINLSCRQILPLGVERLYLVGCDTVGPSDIWLTSRPIGSVTEWFSNRSTWSILQEIGGSVNLMSSPTLVVDTEGNVHLFWSQTDETQADVTNTAIYYARKDREAWVGPVKVLSSAEGLADHPAIAIDNNNRLHAVWSGGQSGNIYQSWANAALANNNQEWTKPSLLPAARLIGSSPSLLVDPAGNIYVAYAIPVNESRGIYLTKSSDGGQTWEQPVKVFDAAAAQWEMVDDPKISLTTNGHLHLLWTRYGLPGRIGSLDLHYARSEDGGATWSEPNVAIEKPIVWSQILGAGEGTVHRFWIDLVNETSSLWHQISLDGGLTWGSTSYLTSLGEDPGPAQVVADRAGQIHLVQVIKGFSGKIEIKHLIWDGNRWSSFENREIPEARTLSDIIDLAANITQDGDLLVAYVSKVEDRSRKTSLGQSEALRTILFFTSRTVEIPAAIATPAPADLPTPTPETSIPSTTAQDLTPTPNLTPSMRVVLEKENLLQNNSQSGSAWVGLVIGVIITILIAGFTFGYRIYFLRNKQ